MKKIFFFIIIFITNQLAAQNLYDQKWLFDKYILVDFSSEPPILSLETPSPWLGPGDFTTSICNGYGELQFYSGGCFVGNRLHEVMENGEDINAPFSYTGWCGYGDIPIVQSNTILPFPSDSMRYLLFNLDMEAPPPSITFFLPYHLYYHLIDMTGDGGLGAVIEKKKVAVDDYLARGHLSAVRHANGQDWWVVVPKFDSNCYYIIPVTDTGVGTPLLQCLGKLFPGEHDGGGQSSFSPDETKYARVEPNYGLAMMNFDAASGQFSNPIELTYPTDYLFAHGVCFSGNSRYLYVTAITKVHQFDTEAADIQTSRQLVGEIDPDTLAQGQGALALAKLGPNGKIYIVTPGLHRYISSLERPNCPGALCDFQAHKIMLPANNFAGINNLPHFRVPVQTYDCEAVGTGEAEVAKEVNISPNPANDFTLLATPGSGSLDIYAPEGKFLERRTFAAGETRLPLALRPGLYFLRFCFETGETAVKKLLIQRQ